MNFILAPCFNEQVTICTFLKKLEEVLTPLKEEFRVVIVDDCSQDNTLNLLSTFNFKAQHIQLNVLHLKFNIGHQGAIYQGLLYIGEQSPAAVIIMDCDGEDDPAAIPELLQNKTYDIVEVKRGKRSEGIQFRCAYFLYKMLFRFVTGKTIDFGNYCLINKNIIERIKHTSFVHLPAYLLKQKASTTFITYNRGKRIDGRSKMGYKGLLLHAFKSMIEFAEDLLLLFFRLFVVLMIIFLLVSSNVLYQKFITHTAIPGWFSTLAISLIILAVLCMGFFITGILLLNLMHQQNIKSFKEIYAVIPKAEL
ncbi:glycosyltransferase [Niastella caeni]|uniref:Glycosyltransferase n=1 Tax=Niastella caeni TaxID=2569763 RepID=A0A4S8H8V4_9BACT|nr:glycosyltransferase [Niastella caeni]THU30429.1 glycosyltransferase [Niastella caeni]